MFFPVPCEVAGSNPERGGYSDVTCGCGCAVVPTWGFATCFGDVCMMRKHSSHPHSKQYWPIVVRLGRSLLGLLGQAPSPQTGGGKSPIAHRDRVPRGPSSTKGRIKAESERSQQARGVPGVARCQTVRARFDHESPRFAMPHHFLMVLAGRFRARMDLPKKNDRKKVPLGIRL